VNKLFLIILAILLVAGLIFSGCAESVSSPTTTSAPTSTSMAKYGGTLKLASGFMASQPIGWPSEASSFTVYSMVPCLESLWWVDENWQLQPLLAESWDIAPGWESVTFYLRKGVKFHDGTDWNAQAAKFNLDALKEAKKTGTSAWSSIDVVDDYTLRISLSEFQNIQQTAIAACLFVSPTAFQENGLEWARWHPVGTGPFEFVSFELNVSCEYKKFDGYWGDKPYLDGIKIIYIADPTTQSGAMQAGDADALITRTLQPCAELRDMGFNLEDTREGVQNLVPSSADPTSPLSNKLVREAIEYAIDRETLCETSGYGIWHPAYQMVPSSLYGYNPDIEGRHYDPEKARQLLVEAGFAEGFDTTIIINTDEDQATTLAIQDWLAQVGIRANIEILAPSKKREMRRTSGWSGLLASGVATIGSGFDVAYALKSQYTTEHPSLQKPAGWEELLDQAVTAEDMDTRDALIRQAVKLAYDEVMVIPTYEGGVMCMTAKGVHGLYLSRTCTPYYWRAAQVWLEENLQ
jgi:ABC-type transport system substrate-binding protein